MSARKSWYLVFIISALLLGAWFARAQLVEKIAVTSMQDAGLSEVKLDIAQLALDQSQLATLSFTLATATGQLRFDVQDTNIAYRLPQLADGRLATVVIRQLDLYYSSKHESPATKSLVDKVLTPVKIMTAVRQALNNYHIADALTVQQVNFHGEAFGHLQGQSLQAKSLKKDNAVTAELTLLKPIDNTSADTALSQLQLSSSDKQLTLELQRSETSYHSAQEKPASAVFNIHETKVQGNYHINPPALQAWFSPFRKLENLTQTANLEGTLTVDLSTEKQVNARFTAHSDKLLYKAYRVDKPMLSLRLTYPTQQAVDAIQLQQGSFIKASKVNYQRLSLTDSKFNFAGTLSASADNWLYKGVLSSKQIAARYQDKTVQLKALSANITADANKLALKGGVSPATVPGQFAFDLAHNVTESVGKLTVNTATALELGAEDHRLSLLLTPWPYPFELLTGKLQLQSNADWAKNKDLNLSTRFWLSEAGGSLNDLVFSGLNFEHELKILPTLQSVRASQLSLNHLDSGVGIDNVTSMLAIRPAKSGPKPALISQGLQGEIFGGTFSGDNIVFDLNKNKNRFNIRASNIDLAEVVKTQQLEAISATGRINGNIPVEINENGVFIEDGAFINDVQNGTIRYNPAAGTEQLKNNPLTAIALDALRDFRYSHLSAGVNFTAEGILTINLKLKGSSPELETDRPVHLNINTEQNLLSLLKSLRFAQGVSENIDKKVRRQYEKNKQ